MIVKILSEAGYEEAMLGLSLSYDSNPERSKEIAPNLSKKDGGHNKFLESMIVWLDITAPRYWWAQMDTYRLATKQSGSTMHTIMDRELTQVDFERGIDKSILDIVNNAIRTKAFDCVKGWLPESFLQRRIMCCSYKTLRNIILQRRNHKLSEWKDFCNEIYAKTLYPNLLPEKE